MAQQHKKVEIVGPKKTDPYVEKLLAEFWSAPATRRAGYEPALRDAIAKAELEKRVSDAILLKQALLSLKSKYLVW